MKVAVKNLQNKDVGQIDLDASVFGIEIRQDIMHLMVKYQLNKRRAGTHKVKTRAEVAGTGAKPWKQKGSGRARAGDLKRPIDTGGGIAHGPVVRSHNTDLPKKVRALALRSALSSKLKDGKLLVIDSEQAKDHKTAPMVKSLAAMGISSAFIVGGQDVDVNFARATANIPHIDVVPVQGANVYDILRRETLILTQDAVNVLTERLKA